MFRKLFIIASLCIMTMVTVIALSLVLIDPNDLDIDLSGWISKRTGRKVHILGKQSLEFFPWLGVRIMDLRMEQPQGFGPAPFLTVRQARVRVRLLPLLLRQEVELDRIEILAPHILLQRARDGRNNWDDLLARFGSDADSRPDLQLRHGKHALPVRPFDWQGLVLGEGRVVFHDEMTGEVIDLDEFQLRTDPGSQFGYYASCRIASASRHSGAMISVHGVSHITLHPFNMLLQDAELNIEFKATHEGTPYQGGFSGIADVNLAEERVHLKQGSLSIAGLHLGGTFTGTRLLSRDFTIQGNLQLLDCSSEAVPSEESAPDICSYLENVAATTTVSADVENLTLTHLELRAPGASLEGQASLSWGDHPSLSLDLRGNDIDLDTLLPKESAPSGPLALPDWLLSWPQQLPDLRLSMRTAHCRARGIDLRDLVINATASQGQLEAKVDAASFLDGQAHLTLKTHNGELYTETTLQKGNADRLSGLLFGAPHMQGVVSLHVTASTTGATNEAIWRNLRLQGEMELAKGALDFTTPPKMLGQTPQPNFRFSRCKAKLAFSNADAKAPASKLPLTYTLEASFTELAPAGLFSTALRGKKYAHNVNGDCSLRGTAFINVSDPAFLGVEKTRLKLSYNGPGTHVFPEEYWEFQGTGTGMVNMKQDVFSISDINGTLPGLRFQGSFTIENAFMPGKPSRYSGSFIAPAFVPRKALPLFGIQAPPTEAAYALNQAGLAASYAIDDVAMDIELHQLTVDKSAITGSIKFSGLDRPGPLRHSFQLTVDEWDMDAYLPPQHPSPETAPRTWDSAWLRDLDLEGTLAITRTHAWGMTYDDLRATVQAAGGRLQFRPVSARFYGGELFSILTLDALPKGGGLAITTECSIAAFQLENVIQDLGGGDVVGGTASWDMHLAGGGTSWKQLMRTLGGKAEFKVKEGYYTLTSEGKSRTPPKSAPGLPRHNAQNNASDGKTRMSFSNANATFFIQDGMVDNKDFLVQGLMMQAQGSGTASLPSRTIDYTILVQMTGAPTIPVHIYGPFADPAVEISHKEMITDTVGRIGGSVFSVFKSILTLPFKAVKTLTPP